MLERFSVSDIYVCLEAQELVHMHKNSRFKWLGVPSLSVCMPFVE